MDITSHNPVLLIGGAEVTAADIEEALSYTGKMVAADGGGNTLLAQDLVPDLVVGDMDSLSPKARKAFAGRLFPVEEQNTTDFDKALRHIEAPLVLALGMWGGRMDHGLAGLNVLLRHPDRPCVIIGDDSLAFLCPPDLALDLPPGSVVSLFPMAVTQIASEGLKWATEGLTLDPFERTGTSNVAVGPVRLRPVAPAVLVILPRDALADVVRAFAVEPARWPARSPVRAQ